MNIWINLFWPMLDKAFTNDGCQIIMVPKIYMMVLFSFRPVILLLLYDSLIKADVQNNCSTFYLFHIVTCLLKVGIADAERASITMEWLCKHVSMATQSRDRRSGHPVWFCYSGFQQTCHNIFIHFFHLFLPYRFSVPLIFLSYHHSFPSLPPTS